MPKLRMGKPRTMSKKTYLSENDRKKCREIIDQLNKEYGGVPPFLLNEGRKKARIYCSDYIIRKFLKEEGFVYDGVLWRRKD